MSEQPEYEQGARRRMNLESGFFETQLDGNPSYDPLVEVWGDNWEDENPAELGFRGHCPYNNHKKITEFVLFRIIYEKHVNPTTKKIKRIVDETMIITKGSEAHTLVQGYCASNNYETCEQDYKLPNTGFQPGCGPYFSNAE